MDRQRDFSVACKPGHSVNFRTGDLTEVGILCVWHFGVQMCGGSCFALLARQGEPADASDSDRHSFRVIDQVAPILHERAREVLSDHSRGMVAVIAFSLFLDYFLYGLLFPLIAHFPTGLKGEGHLALLYGVYAISVLVVTPVFGYMGDRVGPHWPSAQYRFWV